MLAGHLHAATSICGARVPPPVVRGTKNDIALGKAHGRKRNCQDEQSNKGKAFHIRSLGNDSDLFAPKNSSLKLMHPGFRSWSSCRNLGSMPRNYTSPDKFCL